MAAMSSTTLSPSSQHGNMRSASVNNATADTVLLRMMARQRLTAAYSNKHLPALNVDDRQSLSTAADCRQLAISGTNVTPTATHNRATSTLHYNLRQTRSTMYDYHDISRVQFPKHLQPKVSPVKFNIATTTAESGAEHDHVDHPDRCDCDVSCQSLSSQAFNELHPQTAAAVTSPMTPRASKLAIIADIGFTPQEFTWLSEVDRSLNPYRRHQWSDS